MWGFTIVGADQADFYVEDVNPANTDEYKVGENWTLLADPQLWLRLI